MLALNSPNNDDILAKYCSWITTDKNSMEYRVSALKKRCKYLDADSYFTHAILANDDSLTDEQRAEHKALFEDRVRAEREEAEKLNSEVIVSNTNHYEIVEEEEIGPNESTDPSSEWGTDAGRGKRKVRWRATYKAQ